MASPNPNFDTIASATLKNYHPKLVEDIYDFQALFAQMKERDFLATEAGGTSIVYPIMHGKNSTVKSYSGYDLLDTTPQEGFTSLELPWKYLSVSISISGKEEFENTGDKVRIFNLLDGKIKQAEESLRIEMNRQLFQDGTGNSGKDLTGLALAVQNGAAWGTYAGIDRSQTIATFWRNQYLNFTAANTSFGTVVGKTTQGISALRTMVNTCSRGNSKPTLIITTQSLYEAYEANIEGDKLRFTDTKLGDLGFANLTYKGIPIVFDSDCPSNTMYFLNANYMKLTVGKGRNFTTTDFKRPQNQDAKVAQILWTGNLVTQKCDQQGVIVNFVPSP
jgi:predicted RNA-binding protein YlqC (UPF0109 family)